MKTIKLILSTLILSIGLTSCTSDSVDTVLEVDSMASYQLSAAIEGNGHIIELYSDNENFVTGFNEIMVRIKDQVTGTYFSDPKISWMPMMHMKGMAHSCPTSQLVVSSDNNTIARGYMVFQMPGNAEEFWDITFTYEVAGSKFEITQTIDVLAPKDNRQRVATFMGADENKYVLAMVAPKTPKVAVNDFKALLFKMENTTSFPIVEDYKVVLDPRMPSMGNHGSPNNEDLTYDSATKSYHGKLSLTMTGYWKINMTLFNESDELLKGELVTDEQEASSLYFEVEF